MSQGADLCIPGQVLYEFWVVATRPVASDGLGLTPDEAELHIAGIRGGFRLLPDPRTCWTVGSTCVSDTKSRAGPLTMSASPRGWAPTAFMTS